MRIEIVALLTMAFLQTASAASFPDGCLLRSEFPCALTTDRIREKIQLKDGSVLFMGQGVKVLLRSAQEISLVAGALAMQAERPIQVLHGSAQVKVHGEALLERKDQNLKISSIEGEFEIRGPGIQPEKLSSGWSQVVGPIDPRTGQLVTEVAAPLDFQSILVRWLQLKGVKATELPEQVAELRSHWQQAVAKAAQIYAEDSEKLIREARTEKQKRQEALERERAETSRLREMFRERSL